MKEIKVRRLSVLGPGGGGGGGLETGRVYVIKAGLGVPESAINHVGNLVEQVRYRREVPLMIDLVTLFPWLEKPDQKQLSGTGTSYLSPVFIFFFPFPYSFARYFPECCITLTRMIRFCSS